MSCIEIVAIVIASAILLAGAFFGYKFCDAICEIIASFLDSVFNFWKKV